MAEGTDYAKILAELLEERTNLDRMIAWIQGKLAKEEQGVGPIPATMIMPSAPQGGAPLLRFPRLRQDAFFKMSVPEAIRAFLNIMKRPQTARDITDALQAGGLSHKAKDQYQTVFPTLQRMKSNGEVDKLANGEWGLSEWYTAGRRAEPENAKHEPD
jgi:hypothetical protein